MKVTDKELVLACRKGDERAWESLVDRYQRLIFAIPRRAGLDNDEAAEVFQDVFTTLFEKLDLIEEPDRLHAWITTTTKRKTWRQILKRKASAPRFVSADPEDAERELAELPDGSPLADEVMMQLEEQHRVRAALNDLDGRCRKLLTLLFYTNTPPSYAEIAENLGTSEGSIGPTRARCLEKMLRLLRD